MCFPLQQVFLREIIKITLGWRVAQVASVRNVLSAIYVPMLKFFKKHFLREYWLCVLIISLKIFKVFL
jgi:hypothetical protein